MQQNLFTEGEMTNFRTTITKQNVSRSTFYQGDCLIEMDKIADKSIDMILCDLPYGTTACKWDSVIPFEPLWKHYERVIKSNGAIVLTASQPFTTALIMSNIKLYRHCWVWDKISISNPFQVNYAPLKCHEDILVFYKKKATYHAQKTDKPKNEQRPIKFTKNYNGDRNYKDGIYGNSKKGLGVIHDETKTNPKTILQIPAVYKKHTIHPTEKPVSLMEYLIKTYTNEGETVLDNCMGSGTTGVACRNTNRHFIGIEKDKKYFDIAVKRVSDCTTQVCPKCGGHGRCEPTLSEPDGQECDCG